jgi:predicted dehydrogenase
MNHEGHDRLGIALIGAGQIAAAGHVPAYQLNTDLVTLIGVFDPDRERASALAGKTGATVWSSLEELLEDPRVDLVDIAAPPADQFEAARLAIESGKNVLAQKPLALSLTAAEYLVELAASHGRVLAVNQQMRWSPAIRELAAFHGKHPIEHLWFDLVWEMSSAVRLPVWIAESPRFVGLFNTIHFLDTARWLLGEPLSVQAWTRKTAISGFRGETEFYANIRFGDSNVAIRDVRTPQGSPIAGVWATSDDALFVAHLGLWDRYPDPSPDLVITASRGSEPRKLTTSDCWIPHAFAARLKNLATAIRNGFEPSASGQDNLSTLRLLEACYQSAALDGVEVSLQSGGSGSGSGAPLDKTDVVQLEDR